jgi:hypothetical protein
MWPPQTDMKAHPSRGKATSGNPSQPLLHPFSLCRTLRLQLPLGRRGSEVQGRRQPLGLAGGSRLPPISTASGDNSSTWPKKTSAVCSRSRVSSPAAWPTEEDALSWHDVRACEGTTCDSGGQRVALAAEAVVLANKQVNSGTDTELKRVTLQCPCPSSRRGPTGGVDADCGGGLCIPR